MPDDTPPVQHRPIPWTRHDHAVPDGFTVTPIAENKGFEVNGVCPGCGGRIRREWRYGSGNGYKGIFKHRQPPRPKPGPRTVRCCCGHFHADRPAEETLEAAGPTGMVNLP